MNHQRKRSAPGLVAGSSTWLTQALQVRAIEHLAKAISARRNYE
jgi:hypothetical protein